MVNPRLAGRYAKSLIDIAVEKNTLEAVKADVALLLGAIQASPELKRVLRSPIIKADKKLAVMKAICTGRVSAITEAFATLLINKGRENAMPEILAAFNEQYNALKGIQQINITTAQPLSEELKTAILSRLKVDTGYDKVELTAKVKEELIGGFVLEYNNNLVDASIQRDLRDIKRQFLNNDYIFNIK